MHEHYSLSSHSPEPACLFGGPADGVELPERYAIAERIQVPITDGTTRFATYRQQPKGSRRFVFNGFAG